MAKWQPRTLQVRMSKDMGVQVPPWALELGSEEDFSRPFFVSMNKTYTELLAVAEQADTPTTINGTRISSVRRNHLCRFMATSVDEMRACACITYASNLTAGLSALSLSRAYRA